MNAEQHLLLDVLMSLLKLNKSNMIMYTDFNVQFTERSFIAIISTHALHEVKQSCSINLSWKS